MHDPKVCVLYRALFGSKTNCKSLMRSCSRLKLAYHCKIRTFVAKSSESYSEKFAEKYKKKKKKNVLEGRYIRWISLFVDRCVGKWEQ